MPRRIAILIGNGLFDSETIQDLKAPKNDVRLLGKALASEGLGNFEVFIYQDKNSYSLQKDIEFFFKKASFNDVVLFYYSGHGLKDSKGDLYFSTKDSDPNLLNSTAMPADFLKKMMQECKSKRQAVILDCCYSGIFGKELMAKGEVYNEVVNRLSGVGRIILSSSSPIGYSFESTIKIKNNELSISLFTKILLSGIVTGEADKDCDGFISIQELFEYISDQMKESDMDQVPSISNVNSEGILLISKNVQYKRQANLVITDATYEVLDYFKEITHQTIKSLPQTIMSTRLVDKPTLSFFRILHKSIYSAIITTAFFYITYFVANINLSFSFLASIIMFIIGLIFFYMKK